MAGVDKPLNEFGVVDQIIELVKGMPVNDQRILLEQLKDKVSKRRRLHTRKPYFMVVDYATHDRTYADFIKDISFSGVFIQTHKPFTIGQAISLTFPLPDQKKHIKINGEIIRTSEEGIGVKFHMFDGSQEEMIKSLLEMI